MNGEQNGEAKKKKGGIYVEKLNFERIIETEPLKNQYKKCNY